MRKLVVSKLIAGAVFAAVIAGQSSGAYAATAVDIYASTDRGIAYLTTQQQASGAIAGAFGSETDWSIIAAVASGNDPRSFAKDGVSLIDFAVSKTPSASTPTTDIERAILAITAAGEDPSAFGGHDYTALLLTDHDGTQIGDPTLLNDDSFGLMAIYKLEDPAFTQAAQDALDYLIANQQPDGGFAWTTNTSDPYYGTDTASTSAAVLAMLAGYSMGLSHPDLDNALATAVAYLLTTQQPDGGFGYNSFGPSDGSSTAWVLMALNVLRDIEAYQPYIESAQAWLLANQNADGGFSYGAFGYTTSDTNTTPQAIIALLGTNWLLDPAAIARPATPAPTSPAEETAPVVIVPASAPQPLPQSTTVVTDTAPVTPVTTTPTTDKAEVQAQQTTESETDDQPAADTDNNPFMQALGYGLIALAIGGFGAYLLYLRRTPQS